MDRAAWERRLRDAPVWTDAAGRRCLRLPNGLLYAKTKEELADLAVAVLSDPDEHRRDRVEVVLRKLLSADELAVAERIVDEVGPLAQAQAALNGLLPAVSLN